MCCACVCEWCGALRVLWSTSQSLYRLLPFLMQRRILTLFSRSLPVDAAAHIWDLYSLDGDLALWRGVVGMCLVCAVSLLPPLYALAVHYSDARKYTPASLVRHPIVHTHTHTHTQLHSHPDARAHTHIKRVQGGGGRPKGGNRGKEGSWLKWGGRNTHRDAHSNIPTHPSLISGVLSLLSQRLLSGDLENVLRLLTHVPEVLLISLPLCVCVPMFV